jgi:HD-GYP domain-containing protein (c-di-GMP phosphodiesterase class II)
MGRGLTTEGAPVGLRFSELAWALSYALDLGAGRPPGSAARGCLIGMRMAAALRLGREDRTALYYALLLRDAGCSFVAARMAGLFRDDDLTVNRALALADWSRPSGRWKLAWDYTRQGAGLFARIARLADLVLHDGSGMPAGLAGRAIPLLGRIAGVAHVTESFVTGLGPVAAQAMLAERRGAWFDPELVDVLARVATEPGAWSALSQDDLGEALARFELEDPVLPTDRRRLDTVAEAFARVIDAKSPFTYRHSEGVATIAFQIGEALQMPDWSLPGLRWAALLHDIGKLGISNLILDKAGSLSPEEMAVVRRHPAFTLEILRRIPGLREIAEVAGSHHEMLDGSGYHRGLTAERLPVAARVLTVADMAEAMSSGRPYRAGMDWSRVIRDLRAQAGVRICAECVSALAALPMVRGSGVELWCPLR